MNKTIGDQGKLISFANEVFADIKPLPDFADKVANNLLVNSISETPIKLIDSIGSQITTMNKTITTEEGCTHEPLVDTGVGYYHCPACDQGWSYQEWESRNSKTNHMKQTIPTERYSPQSGTPSSSSQVTTVCAKELRGEEGCKDVCGEGRTLEERAAVRLSMEEILRDAVRRKATYSVQYADYDLNTWTAPVELTQNRMDKLLDDGSIRKVRLELEM